MGLISTWYQSLGSSIILLPNLYFRFYITDWECILLVQGCSCWDMDQSHRIILTPFNFFEWKAEIDIFLRSKGLFRVTMEIEADPNVEWENIKCHNRRDEVYGLLCINISRDLFHLDGLKSLNEVWEKSKTYLEG